jgi:hypothetical protein
LGFPSQNFIGIPYTNFQNPLYLDFPLKKFPAVFGPPGLGWPLGGPAAAARVRAPMRGTGKHPEQQLATYCQNPAF